MVRAAVSYGFDFTSYDPRNAMHRQKLRLYKQQILREDELRLAEFDARRYLAEYMSRGFENESRMRSYDNLANARQRIQSLLNPSFVALQAGDIVSAMEAEYAEAVASGEIRGGPAFEKKA